MVSLGVAFAAAAAESNTLRFASRSDGGFGFDTGIIRGRLRAEGESLGLQQVAYARTGQRLDRGNGLLSPYRLFSSGKRYGTAAWDWESAARLLDDGSVQVTWTDAPGPFVFAAIYRIVDPSTVELETRVTAREDLPAFECFVASYFHERFTNSAVCVATNTAAPERFAEAARDAGEWQMFPRDPEAARLIRDGRWRLGENPVDWTIRDAFALPLARRRAPASGLSGILMSPPGDCFAIATPHQTEAHHALYFSLFGNRVAAGETAVARVRWSLVVARSDDALLNQYTAAFAPR
jgi:hypothetical protein